MAELRRSLRIMRFRVSTRDLFKGVSEKPGPSDLIKNHQKSPNLKKKTNLPKSTAGGSIHPLGVDPGVNTPWREICRLPKI